MSKSRENWTKKDVLVFMGKSIFAEGLGEFIGYVTSVPFEPGAR